MSLIAAAAHRCITRISPAAVSIYHRRFAAQIASSVSTSSIGDRSELRLTFASPTKVYYENEPVRQIDVRTLTGDVGIVAQHVPTIAMLADGNIVIYELNGEQKRLYVSGGSLSMNIDGGCVILPKTAIPAEDHIVAVV